MLMIDANFQNLDKLRQQSQLQMDRLCDFVFHIPYHKVQMKYKKQRDIEDQNYRDNVSLTCESNQFQQPRRESAFHRFELGFMLF